MAATALKVPEKSAKRLLKELNVTGAAKASPKKLATMLTEARDSVNGQDVEDMELSNSSKSLLEEVIEAVDDDKDIKVTAAADVEEEDEEEEAPKKKTKGTKTKVRSQKVKTQKKSAKKGTKVEKKARKTTGGKTAKDQVFEAWLKNPSITPKQMAEKMADRLDHVKATTISGWTGGMKRGAEGAYPRISKGREKEIKAARKASRSSD